MINETNGKGAKPDIFDGCLWFVLFGVLALFTKGATVAIIALIIIFINYLINKYNY